jgi:hypothetical protein
MTITMTSLLIMAAAVGCGSSDSETPPSSASSIYEGDYSVSIVAVGATTINSGRTVTLRTTVTGTTQKDVTWSSLNSEVATVSDRGLVTGVVGGTATIKATLDIDPNCFDTIDITVLAAIAPETLSIDGQAADGIGWVGETETLTVAVTPEDASNAVIWASDNEEVATVADGVVTFVDSGTVTITATSQHSELSDSVVYEVRKGVFLSNMPGTTNAWDTTHQSDSVDSYVELPQSTTFNPDILYFANFIGQRYYIEATFEIIGLNATNAWDWNGFGVGSARNDNDARGFRFAPHPAQNNSANKTLVADFPVSWGAITTRSQIWREYILNDIDVLEPIKISMLRDNNNYYYFINDNFLYYDETTKFDAIDTYPVIFSVDIPVKATDYELITDETELNTKLASDSLTRNFFPAHDDIAEYIDDENFDFKNQSYSLKDSKINYIGDKAKLVGQWEVEFDLAIDALNNADGHAGIGINMRRYDSADISETITIGSGLLAANFGKTIARFQKWDWVSQYRLSSNDWAESSLDIVGDEIHVKMSRTINPETNEASFKVFVNGVEQTFATNYKNNAKGAYSTYTGAYLMSVISEYASGTVSNFTFQTNL